MKKKIFSIKVSKLLLLPLFVLIVSCSGIKNVPDVEVCIRLIEGASCTKTITGGKRELSEDEYRETEVGNIVMDATAYGSLKAFILKACKLSKHCKVKDVEKHFEAVDETYFRAQLSQVK